MTSSENQVELRTPEMQEIIGRIPNRIIRWGITVLFLVMVALLFISWIIRYPDLLPAKVMVTTTPPPVTLVARTSGNLTLTKNENVPVNSGDLIAFIQCNATPETVLAFEKSLLANDSLPIKNIGSLGDLQAAQHEVINSMVALQNFETNKIFDTQIEQFNRQVTTYKKLSWSLAKQEKLAMQELTLAKEKFKTDSILFVQKVTAAIDFNAARTTWLQQQRGARNAETALINNEAQLNLLSKQIADLEIQKLEQGQKLTLTVQHAKQAALAQIAKWKETYLFVAPTAGTLSYLGFLENNQFIEPGKPYFTVLPEGGQLMARAELPLRGSGKVKVGQAVNIRLENYPFEQFGLLRGRVTSISLMPDEEKYWVTITLPDQLLTSQKKVLPFKQQLAGTTEIITEDLRLLERFFYQFRKLAQAR